MKIISKTKKYFTTFNKVIYLIWISSKFYTILFLLLNIFSGLYYPILLIIWKYFINAVTLPTSKPTDAIFFLLLHCGAIILMDFTNRICNYVEDVQSKNVNKYIMDITLSKIDVLKMSHFDDNETFNKIEKINNESTQRSISILKTTLNSIRSFTTLFSMVIILLRLNVLLVIICFISCIPMFMLSTKISLKRYFLFDSRTEKLRLVYRLKNLIINYDNIKEIKINRVNSYLKNQAISIYKEHLSEDKKINKSFIAKFLIANIVQNIMSYSFKLYILIDILFKKIYTIGDLTMFITAIDGFQNALEIILKTISDLYVDSLYIENLFSLLAIETDNLLEDKIIFNPNFKEIEFRNVYFKYIDSKNYVLENINLKISAGKSYSIVGLNGSGKTTLIKLLTKIYEPTKGAIFIDGVNLSNFDDASYYENIGVIFQDFIRYPFDVAKNIGIGNIKHLMNIELIKEAANKSGADVFINKLPNKYRSVLQKEWSEGTELSLGQWQKLAISRAYMSQSPIMVLDEPTSSLDAEAEYELYMHFKQIMCNKTCILISHRLSASKIVDEIIVLKNGKLIENGTHDSLISRDGEYARIYNMQAHYYD